MVDFRKLLPVREFRFYLVGGREFITYRARKLDEAIEMLSREGLFKLADVERIDRQGLQFPKEDAVEILMWGEFDGWVKKNPSGEVSKRKVQWEIKHSPDGGQAFYLTKGAVTGYEGFVLYRPEDHANPRTQGFNLHALTGWSGSPVRYWSACAGGSGWDELRIWTEDVQKVLARYCEQQQIEVLFDDLEKEYYIESEKENSAQP